MKKTFSQKIFSSSLYPRLPQAFAIYVFVLIFASLIFGPKDADSNFGLVTTWILWWPLLPLSLFFLGRAWCAFCPWGAATDWLQSHFCFNFSVPKWIKKYGIWVILGGFVFLSWYELAYGFTSSKFATAGVLIFITVLALTVSLLFEKRVWCRYLCPLGGVLGNYAQAAIIEFRGTEDICTDCKQALCLKGSEKAPGCNLSEFPKKMDSNRLCNLCGDCVKNCENNSPSFRLRTPGRELWEKAEGKLDEALLSSLLVGIILVSGFGMLEFWINLLENINTATGLNIVLLTTISFIAFGLGALAITLLASYFSAKSSKEPLWKNFTRYGYALIPLNLAAHISHNLFHFLGEGKNILITFSSLFMSAKAQASEAATKSMGENSASMMSVALAPEAVIQTLQTIIMILGIIASIAVAWKITKKVFNTQDVENKGNNAKLLGSFLPYLIVIIFFGAISFLMFILPMAMRG